jgi:hypothetical protein
MTDFFIVVHRGERTFVENDSGSIEIKEKTRDALNEMAQRVRDALNKCYEPNAAAR